MKNYLAEAIWKLRPGSEFSFQEQDYATVEWLHLQGSAPTKVEIEAALEIVKEEEKIAELAAVEAKANAETKLKALGLTADDLRVLGLA
jgi:hypothetical protein